MQEQLIREIIRLQKRIKEKPNVKPVIESSQLGGNYERERN